MSCSHKIRLDDQGHCKFCLSCDCRDCQWDRRSSEKSAKLYLLAAGDEIQVSMKATILKSTNEVHTRTGEPGSKYLIVDIDGTTFTVHKDQVIL